LAAGELMQLDELAQLDSAAGESARVDLAAGEQTTSESLNP